MSAAPPGTPRHAAAFAACRSTRRGSVRSPRSTRKQSNGPGHAAHRVLQESQALRDSSKSLVTATPTTVSECPPRYFVAEWNTMSAPSSSGRWSAGEANVLSTTTSGPLPARGRPFVGGRRRGLDVDELQERVRRRLEPDQARRVRRATPTARRGGRAGRRRSPTRRHAAGHARGSGTSRRTRHRRRRSRRPVGASSAIAAVVAEPRGEGDAVARRPRVTRPRARAARGSGSGNGRTRSRDAAGRRRPGGTSRSGRSAARRRR